MATTTQPRPPLSVPAPSGAARRVAHGVAALRVYIVNVYFVGLPRAFGGDGSWVLVDAGMPRSAAKIRTAAEEVYGPGARPKAIVLTHGHFDHVGALNELADAWDVPVYAHELELPYITGRSSYPPPDPTVGGGLMARSAPLYPRGPYDVGARAKALPADGTVPDMPGWRWVATAGHSPGHVSFFRDSDRTLIAGDAFVTTKQESLSAVLSQRQEIHGPPMYFTQDWPAARESVRRLEALRPALALTGHGPPMSNPRLAHDLHLLAAHFDDVAVPRHGRYVNAPAFSDETGTLAVPPPVPDPVPKLLVGLVIAGAAVATVAALNRDDRDHERGGRAG